jgi:hypothetical protein
MRLAEFETHIADRIEASIQNAETYFGRERRLPRRRRTGDDVWQAEITKE